MGNPVSRWFDNTFDAAEGVANKRSSTAKSISEFGKLSKSEQKKEIDRQTKEARGQFLGALLQNRKYDERGRIVGASNARSSGGINKSGGKSVNPTYNTY